MKKAITILAIGILSISLTACGNNKENQADQNTQSEITEANIDSLIDEESIPDVIATVNGEDITKETYVVTLENMVLTQGLDPDSDEAEKMLETMKEQLIEKIINERVMIQAATEEGIEVSDEEIDEKLVPVTSQFESEEELQETLDNEGVTMEELRADLAKLIKLDKYIQKHTKKEEISEEELKQAYNEVVKASDAEEIPPFNEYKDMLKAQIEYEQEEEQITELIEELREDSEVKIYI